MNKDKVETWFVISDISLRDKNWQFGNFFKSQAKAEEEAIKLANHKRATHHVFELRKLGIATPTGATWEVEG